MVYCKICGIRKPENAYFAAQKGADYVGLIFHEDSPRYVSGTRAIEVALAAKEGGAIPVAVFTSHNGKEMLEICHELKIDTVQLHGNTARKEHTMLPDSFTRFYAVSVALQGGYVEPKCDKLSAKRDLLLYDGPNPGTGTKFHWGKFAPLPKFPFGIAGGLSPENVRSAITLLHPRLVDVSSGVELHGEKDRDQIRHFIEEAKSV